MFLAKAFFRGLFSDCVIFYTDQRKSIQQANTKEKEMEDQSSIEVEGPMIATDESSCGESAKQKSSAHELFFRVDANLRRLQGELARSKKQLVLSHEALDGRSTTKRVEVNDVNTADAVDCGAGSMPESHTRVGAEKGSGEAGAAAVALQRRLAESEELAGIQRATIRQLKQREQVLERRAEETGALVAGALENQRWAERTVAEFVGALRDTRVRHEGVAERLGRYEERAREALRRQALLGRTVARIQRQLGESSGRDAELKAEIRALSARNLQLEGALARLQASEHTLRLDLAAFQQVAKLEAEKLRTGLEQKEHLQRMVRELEVECSRLVKLLKDQALPSKDQFQDQSDGNQHKRASR